MQSLTHPLNYLGERIGTLTERTGAFIDGSSTGILEKMFTIFDGTKVRKNTAFLKALTIAMQHTEFPTFDDVWDYAGQEYADTTKKQNRSWINRSGWTEEDRFGEKFWDEYVRRCGTHAEKAKRLAELKSDCAMRHEYDVDSDYDYDNTMDIIRKNPHVMYRLPTMPVKTLDYFDTKKVQIIKMNHVGGNPVVQLPLLFNYRCNKCRYETDLPYDAKSVPCSGTECDGKMTRVKSHDTVRPAYASRVVTDDMNSISIISLSPLPQGEFIGAVFLCRSRADYYLFMIATEEIAPTSSTVTIDTSKHAIWQLINQIDLLHEDRIGKHIHGLGWYKAGILLAYLANCKGRVSTNVIAVGDPGVGKTSAPRLYIATLTPQQKVQDAMNLSGPGLHGSMAQVKIGDAVINVPEAGFLARHRLVVIDELLDNRNALLPQLKTALMSTTISREVHGNRTLTPKYATAIATSNIPLAVVVEQKRWMGRWIIEQCDGVVNDVTEQDAHKAMVEEWTERGTEWHTGQSLADMDRYPLIYFVRDKNDDLAGYDLEGEDNAIDDLKLAKLVYDSDIDEYFNFCGRIVVDWKPHQDRIIKLVKSLREHDKIHSRKRLGQNITLMLQLSAQINGRDILTDDDFDFVEELWSKTCHWVDVTELDYAGEGVACVSDDDWNIQRVKLCIHTRMNEYVGTKYYGTDRAFSLIAAELEGEGAPLGLIETTIEHYRQNPNQ